MQHGFLKKSILHRITCGAVIAAITLISSGCSLGNPSKEAAVSIQPKPSPSPTDKVPFLPSHETPTILNPTTLSEDTLTVKSIRDNSKWQHTTKFPILMYHSISHHPSNTLCVDPVLFQEEMQHLRDGNYTPITFDDLEIWEANGKLPPKPILITLDDGYKDNYTNAFPALKASGMKATIFLITDAIGSKNSLSWNEIDEMRASGLVQIGSHTVNHLDLTKLTSAARAEQVKASKRALEAHFGSPVIAFCYPSGRYNRETVTDVKSAGYEFAVTTVPGEAARSQGNLTLDRVRIPGNMSLDAFNRLFP